VACANPRFDAFGDRWSRLTFLVYLNDGFEGGATTFYAPAAPSSSGGAALEARSVQPVAGNILVRKRGGGGSWGCGSVRCGGYSVGAGARRAPLSVALQGAPRSTALRLARLTAGLNARLVLRPQVFPHGDTRGALVHEGSAVTRGSKYVFRTVSRAGLPVWRV
jgi:hypothetical protein